MERPEDERETERIEALKKRTGSTEVQYFGQTVAVVRPGDVLIVAYNRELTKQMVKDVTCRLGDNLPEGVRVCVLDSVQALDVIRDQRDD